MLYGYEEDMPLATPADAIREWVWVVGQDRPNSAWLCSDYDTWVANPHYQGPPVPHPESLDWDDLIPGDFVEPLTNEDGDYED